MSNPFISMISRIISISPELEQALDSKMKYETVKKKQILLDLGQMCPKKFFIVKGMLRSFYYRDGEEVTNWFRMEDDVAFSLLSFYRKRPSFEIIEALEDCEVITWTYEDQCEWYAKYVELNKVGRILTERDFCESEERMIAMRKQTALERYLDLLETNPEIIKRASNKNIASYLGMSEGNLSRIKLNLKTVTK